MTRRLFGTLRSSSRPNARWIVVAALLLAACGSELGDDGSDALVDGAVRPPSDAGTTTALDAASADAGPVDVPEDAGPPDAGPPDAGDTLPTIWMERLVVQAQVEPFRGDQPSLPGDFAVEQVQQALADEGFDVSVDGWFGNMTAAGYSGWQERLGYSGLDANGIPGPSSLEALAEDRFVVTRRIAIGGRTTYSGRTINQRTRDMLAEARSMLGHDIVVTQGSYNAGGVTASAGTHDGGGAVDVSVRDLSTTQRWETVRAMRRVGFAAWLRTASQGPWPDHIHAIAVGDTDLSSGARNQVADYFVGRNGLASHAADNTPSAYQVPFTWWEKYRRE